MALFFRPVSGVAVWAGLSRRFSGLGWIQAGVCCSQWQGLGLASPSGISWDGESLLHTASHPHRLVWA